MQISCCLLLSSFYEGREKKRKITKASRCSDFRCLLPILWSRSLISWFVASFLSTFDDVTHIRQLKNAEKTCLSLYPPLASIPTEIIRPFYIPSNIYRWMSPQSKFLYWNLNCCQFLHNICEKSFLFKLHRMSEKSKNSVSLIMIGTMCYFLCYWSSMKNASRYYVIENLWLENLKRK